VGDEHGGSTRTAANTDKTNLEVRRLCGRPPRRFVHEQHPRLEGQRRRSRPCCMPPAMPGTGGTGRRSAPPPPAPARRGPRATRPGQALALKGSSDILPTFRHGNRLRPYSETTPASPSGGPVTRWPPDRHVPDSASSQDRRRCAEWVYLPPADGTDHAGELTAFHREVMSLMPQPFRPCPAYRTCVKNPRTLAQESSTTGRVRNRRTP